MKIRKLTLRDFRGIPEFDLDLTHPDTKESLDLIVMAGRNGCGKTSLLEAILLCLDRSELLPERAVGKSNVRQSSEGFHLKLEVEDRESPCVVELHSGPGGSYQLTERLRPAQVAYFSSWRAPRLVGPVSITAGKRGRKLHATEENRLWRIKNFFVNLRARRAFMDETQSVAPASTQEQEALHHLSQAWRHFYPNTPDRFEALVASEKVEEGFDLFLVRNGAPPMPVDWLSSGELEVLAFLGSFLLDDFSGGIVLIDEPELHLHPAWHRVILKAIRSLLPEAQLICATHSPQVLSEIEPAHVRLLKRQGHRLTASIPEDSYGLDANRILEELLDAPDRPPEIKDHLRRLFLLIDQGDLPAAKTLVAALQGRIHADPDLTKADLLIRRKEALAK